MQADGGGGGGGWAIGKKRDRKGEKGAESTLSISSPSVYLSLSGEKMLKGTVSSEP